MNTYRFMEWDLMDVFICMLSLLLVCGIFLCVFSPEKGLNARRKLDEMGFLIRGEQKILIVKCIVKNKYVISTTIKKCKELNK